MTEEDPELEKTGTGPKIRDPITDSNAREGSGEESGGHGDEHGETQSEARMERTDSEEEGQEASIEPGGGKAAAGAPPSPGIAMAHGSTGATFTTAKEAEGMDDPGPGEAAGEARAPGAWPKTRVGQRLPTNALRMEQQAAKPRARSDGVGPIASHPEGSEATTHCARQVDREGEVDRGAGQEGRTGSREPPIRWADTKDNDSSSESEGEEESSRNIDSEGGSTGSAETSDSDAEGGIRAARPLRPRPRQAGETHNNDQPITSDSEATSNGTQHARRRRGRLRTLEVKSYAGL